MLRFLFLSFFSALLLSSCGSSSDVVSNSLIQHRKYRSGFHLNLKSIAAQPRTKSELDLNTDMAMMPVLQRAKTLSSLEHEELNVANLPKQREFSLKRVFKKRQVEIESTEGIIAEIGLEGDEEPEKPVKTYKAETLGLISMILGLSNLILMFVPILGIVCSVVSFVFGIKALKTKDKRAALYGIIGILMACLTFIFAAFWTSIFVWAIIASTVLLI